MKKLTKCLRKECLRKDTGIVFLFFLFIIKMSYYKKNKEVLLEKAYYKYHNLGGKERAKQYYQVNKEEIKKKERLKYWFMPENEKETATQRSLERYYKMKNK